MVKTEIIELHKQFVNWYNANIKLSELEQQIGHRLEKNFSIIYPSASKQTKNDFLKMLLTDHGNDQTFQIEISDISIQLLTETIALASYQEWQYWNNEPEPKLKLQTSSVLRINDETVTWINIHETQIKNNN